MKKKNGFTLIELLAVIVILAIILIIAVPRILNIIDASREKAKFSSLELVRDAIKTQIITSEMTGERFTKNGECYLFDFDNKNDNYTKLQVKNKEYVGGTVKYCDNKITDDHLKWNGLSGDNGKNDKTGPTKELPGENDTFLAIVYLDPTNLNKYCTKEMAEVNVSENGTPTNVRTGCMKWYAYKEVGDKYKLLLNHNTTALTPWNSDKSDPNTNRDIIDEVVQKDTAGWDNSLNPSFISADEIAHLVGADRDDTLKWNSSKIFNGATDSIDLETEISHYNVDGSGNTYSKTGGWQLDTLNKGITSKYYWLFDNTWYTSSFGGKVDDNNEYEQYYKLTSNTHIYGYWTNSISQNQPGYNPVIWQVNRTTSININGAGTSDSGYRPVITISKSILN